jgi:hypothetical protein
MPKYRKKPVVIEARRVQTNNLAEMATWCNGVVYDENLRWDHDSGAVIMPDGHRAHVGYRDWGVIIPTLEGDMLARFGDWIIQGVKGEFYPCAPDIFQATYEPAGAP